ncbi:MAG TPA: MFS transporter [Chlamydiales bacterium]|nr:MFS transporter [Chlamydiales bacterium]
MKWEKPGTIPRENPLYLVLIIANILVVTFLAVVATVSTIMGGDVIQGELALSDNNATWLTTLNLLGINSIVPASSWFGDRFGYKTMLAFGIAVFAVASLLAATSVNFVMLGSARFLEGIGSGFIFPIGLAIITQNLSPQKLSLGLILYVMTAFGAGFAIGLPLSGYLTQFASWRDIFVIIVVISLIAFISIWMIQEDTPRKKTSRFDYFGYIFFALFISTLLIALTYGPMLSTNEGWTSPFILGCFFIAFVSFILTICIESKHEAPILPLGLFRYPIYATTCVAMFLLGMSIFASVGTMMQYMMDALKYERFESGKIGIIYGAPLAIFSVIASILIKKVHVSIVTGMGLCLLVYSYFLNNILDWQTGPNQILWILLLRGVAIGLALGPATVQALESIPKELKNKGATILTFFRQVGGTYGGTLIAILVIKRKIFHAARFGEQANDQLPAFQVTARKLASHYNSTFFDRTGDSLALTKATIIQNLEVQAYIQAINDALFIFGWVTLIVTILLILISILQIWRAKKDRKKQTYSHDLENAH